MKICTNGHLTGTVKCFCGAKAEKGVRVKGAGRVNVKKFERPRDKNGRNELDEIRRGRG